ncbi:hypothetical protein QOZ80_2AG0139470 [Eleusine coracana subsp. coracana]|nr:hypothetical protein QOZ80_2AG0139470 [Eleusine coracana subsp. coracana]
MDSTGHVPVLDFSKVQGTSAERSAAVQDIGRVCLKKGFFQVINHGISTDILAGALEAGAAFFDLPTDDRSDLMSDDVSRPVRYTTVAEVDGSGDGEVKIRRHFLKHYSYPLEEWIDVWPVKPVQYREKMTAYSIEVRRVLSELMDAITESLVLGRDYLKAQMDRGFEMMAVNCYPQQHASSDGHGVICLPAHTDYTLVTVLLENSEGLQEFDREAGTWRAVPHSAESLLVHVGNYLEVVSNGRYRAALHRVASAGRQGVTRISIASLPSLGMDEKVEVARELVDERHPAMYRGSSVREFIEFLSAGGKSSDFMESLKISGTDVAVGWFSFQSGGRFRPTG